jgi:hypothetical protein
MVDEGYYGYILTYDIDKSSAFYNMEGEFIEGSMTSMVFTELPPVNEQEVKIHYEADEPMIFEFIEEIKYQNSLK